MGIKRFTADADTTITNAFGSALTEATRGTGSNMGASDVLETFSIYGQGSSGQYSHASSASVELSRTLIKFPVSDISSSRASGELPVSGSVSFYMRMFNAKHAFTLPQSSILTILSVSKSWQEGTGLDMEGYTDITRDFEGANWVNASSASSGITTWAAAATATITVLNEGFIETGDTITLTATDGTEVVATAHASDNTAAAATTAVTFSHNGANTTAQATLIATAINYSSYFSAESDGAVVTITQATAGSAGNTTVTCVDGGGAGPWFSNTNFTGGHSQGGAHHLSPAYTGSFSNGDEDLEVDITGLVEHWLIGGANHNNDGKHNYGISVHFTSSQEGYSSISLGSSAPASILRNLNGAKKSYYTKKFFSRTSEYFFKRPCIEARWDSTVKDERGSCYVSSSLVNASGNLNTIYLYNYIRGQLRNIPDVGQAGPIIFVQFYTSASHGELMNTDAPYNLRQHSTLTDNPPGTSQAVTGGYVSTGIYSASFALNSSASVVYDRWFSSSIDGAAIDASEHANGANTKIYHTGSIKMKQFSSSAETFNPNPSYVTKITNLKTTYFRDETARFRVFVREKNWNPNVYKTVVTTVDPSIVEKAYYKIFRVTDDLNIITYGTGSSTGSFPPPSNLPYTQLSYDSNGNYFDLSMKILEPDYAYGIKFAYYTNGAYHEQPEIFKFRVE